MTKISARACRNAVTQSYGQDELTEFAIVVILEQPEFGLTISRGLIPTIQRDEKLSPDFRELLARFFLKVTSVCYAAISNEYRFRNEEPPELTIPDIEAGLEATKDMDQILEIYKELAKTQPYYCTIPQGASSVVTETKQTPEEQNILKNWGYSTAALLIKCFEALESRVRTGPFEMKGTPGVN
jgi:hypothetical protein